MQSDQRFSAWLAAACASLLLPGIATADILYVGPEAGQYFTINEALSDAVDGDLILVAPGTYFPFIMNGKSVSVHGSGSGQSIIEMFQGGGPFGIGSAIGVLNSNSNPVSVGGFTVREAPEITNTSGTWVSAADSAEPVEFYDLVLEPSQAFFKGGDLGYAGFFVARNSRQVHFSGVHVSGAGTVIEEPFAKVSPLGWIYGGVSGLVAEDTPVWISDSSFEGSTVANCSVPPLNGNLFVPGYGLYADNSPIVAANTSFYGGGGQPAGGPECPAIDGSPAIRLLNNASLRLYGGPGSEVRGGGGVDESSGGAGALLYGPSAIFHASDVFLEGGLDAQGQAADATVEFNPDLVLVQDYGERRPGISPSRYVVPPGDSLDLNLTGNPGLLHFVLWSETLQEWSSSLPVDGSVFVDPLTAGMIGPTLLDGNGEATVGISVPADPAFNAKSVVMQTVEIEGPWFTPSPTVRIAALH